MQADVTHLKATLRGQPQLEGVPFSTNDVVLALAWFLQCDNMGRTRPGQGPPGSKRMIRVAANAAHGAAAFLTPPGPAPVSMIVCMYMYWR